MIIRCIIPGLLMLVSFSTAAATLQLPFLKVGPLTYSNVTVIGANATDLYFNHDKGIGNVKLKYLSPSLQKRFDYDPVKAAEAERQQAEADALYNSTVASNIALHVQKARAAQAGTETRPITLTDPVSDKSLLGKAAPPLSLDRWIGDKPDLDGKYVLVAFWEPWSAAALAALPDLGRLQKQFADKLVVVGVSTNSEAALEQLEATQPTIPLATDSKAKLCNACGITSIPAVLLVDPQGIVRYEGHPAALGEKNLKSLFASPE